jgi:hypothetical protein
MEMSSLVVNAERLSQIFEAGEGPGLETRAVLVEK